ncbi:MAG: NAD(P)-dependent alcohol dehydrogenase [Myxococcota bacterium]
MQAITQHQYGAPNVLKLNTVTPPTIGPHEVLIEVHASPVTQGDRRLRAADFPGIAKLFGRLMVGLTRPKNTIPGTMFAGRIADVGTSVTRFKPGDRVFGSSLNGGAWAEFLVMPEGGELAHMPQGFGYDEACTLPYGGLTALVFLRDFGQIAAGQRVAIVGASGGVGQFAVQLAHHIGAEVTAVCSRDHARVRALGASEVIDYRVEDFTDGGRRYDIIFDTSGTLRWSQCRHALTPQGRYLSLYLTAELLFRMAVTSWSQGRKALGGVALGTAELLEELRRLAEQGAFRPIIDSDYPLSHTVQAHARLEQGGTFGSVVVHVSSNPEERLAADNQAYNPLGHRPIEGGVASAI